MFKLDKLVQSIGKVSHFKNLPPAALLEIVSAGKVHHFCKDNIIFLEGEPCSGLHVLFRGQIRLSKISHHGQESIISVINPIIMFNEVAVLDGGSNPLTATVNQDCVVWQLSAKAFKKLSTRYPVMPMSLLPVLAARNRQMLHFCEDIAFLTVTARTAKILFELSQNGQEVIDRRVHTNQSMSALTTTVPESFCRSMRVLHVDGIIEMSRTTITVLNPVKLAQIAEVDLVFSD